MEKSSIVSNRVRPEQAINSSEYAARRRMERPTIPQRGIRQPVHNEYKGPQMSRPVFRQPPNNPNLSREMNNMHNNYTQEKRIENPNFQYYTERDFSIHQTEKGNSMRINSTGFVFMAFVDNGQSCHKLANLLDEVVKSREGVIIGIMNITSSGGMGVIKKSANTMTNITQIPTIIMYYNKAPMLMLKEITSDSIINAIEVSKDIVKKNSGRESKTMDKKKIDEDIIGGVPYNMVCNDAGKCYYTTEDIYEGRKTEGLCIDGQCNYQTFEETYK